MSVNYQNNYKLYINFNIKKYAKIDDIIKIIDLIDNNMNINEKIYGLSVMGYQMSCHIQIYRSENTQYDYVCVIDNFCEVMIIEYIDSKFKQIQNLIKFTYDKYGSDWYIDYKLLIIT